jgi:D-arabinose 1-dehydrogenase-like Zn-dependent alcohol dehydrogenase
MMAEGALTSRTTQISFEEVGDAIGRLEHGEIAGRLTVVYD